MYNKRERPKSNFRMEESKIGMLSMRVHNNKTLPPDAHDGILPATSKWRLAFLADNIIKEGIDA